MGREAVGFTVTDVLLSGKKGYKNAIVEYSATYAPPFFVSPHRQARATMTAVPPPSLHRLYDRSDVPVRWSNDSPIAGQYPTALGTIVVHHGVMTSGKSAGVEVCVIDTGKAQVVVLPSRGMAVWQIRTGDVDFGWRSPVDGPVHPSLVPVCDSDGLGWLEGFDELVVRCGLESNGAPEKDDQGCLRYPLHGRLGNLPATSLAVEVNVATGQLALVGDCIESKLFFKRLRLRARIAVTAQSADVHLIDEVTNELSAPATAQMLYHINVGVPLLGAGAKVLAPIARLAPKNELSAGEVDHWNQMPAPQAGYTERVYFAQLACDQHGKTAAMLRSPDGGSGLGVAIDTKTLPYFILWKNTAAEADGYVVGLEPATNFPNARSREAAQGRVVHLPAGETVRFEVTLHPLGTDQEVADFQSRIDTLAALSEPVVLRETDPNWSV